MRYRSFGSAGLAVSAVSLTLSDEKGRGRASDWRDLIFAALENGINAFEITKASPALLEGLADAGQALERRMLFIGLRAGAADTHGFTNDGLGAVVRATLEHTGLGYLDLVSLDNPGEAPLESSAIEFLKSLRAGKLVHRLGVAGKDETVDPWIKTGAFDVLIHPYNLSSGWPERNRIKTATARDMIVIACDAYTADLAEAAKGPKEPLSGMWKRKSDPLSGHGTYAFLDKTHGWTAEEICVAYTLTEPAVATVQLAAENRKQIEALAEVPERDLPTGVSAQIEMARFSAPPGGVERRRRA